MNQSFNSLATPEQLYFDGDFLCFCEENQGVVMWAIRKEDLANPNPPIWGNYGSETDPDWVLENPKLSDLAVYGYLQWYFGRAVLQCQCNGRLGHGRL